MPLAKPYFDSGIEVFGLFHAFRKGFHFHRVTKIVGSIALAAQRVDHHPGIVRQTDGQR